MSNKFSQEESNRRYVEAMAALEVKGDGKCYCPCNDCRGLQTRRILRTSTEKQCKEKGHVTCPNLQNIYVIINIMLYFIIKFVINDQVGSRIIECNC